MIEFTLYPFQEEGVDYLLDHHYAILGDQMGLGKTVQAIEVMNRTELSTLIICPAYLKENWKREIKKFYRHDRSVKIISYASLKKSTAYFKWADLIICDEFHYLKNIKAKRTQYFHKNIGNYPPSRFIGLTGTAIKNRVGEFYSLLATCDYNPKKTSGPVVSDYYSNYWEFCDMFSYREDIVIRGRKITKFEGLRNVDLLKKLIVGKYIRRKAKDVLDLPPVVRKTVSINGVEDREMKEVWNYMKETGDLPHFSTAKAKSAMMKADFTAKYVNEMIENTTYPVLVFTDHVDSAYVIAGYFNLVPITGGTSIKERDKTVRKFQRGDMPVLVATTGSLSVGHTLTASSNLVFNDVPWSPGDLAQAEARIRRISQESTCFIHYISWGHIDELIINKLNEKVEVLAQVL